MGFRLEKGMTVTMWPTGNFARRWNGEPSHGVVEKIGRKYAHIALTGRGRSVYRFDLNTLRCVDEYLYNAGYEIFPDDEAFWEEKERRESIVKINTFIRDGKLTSLDADRIRKIYDLITQEDKK